ncbi:MAG: carboxypeptidase regulatory-like domain-containing protein [Terriglobales bacterium]
MDSVVSKLKVFAFVLALLSLLAFGSGLAFGQAISGSIVGTVIDSSSAVVTNATVEATNVGTGATTEGKTGSSGGYRFENLPVGTYRVSVKAPGFKTVTQQVDVVLNQTGTLNVTLAPGASSETIEVSGVATVIDTSSAQLSSTYDSRFSQDLGITSAGGTGAGVLNLSLLSPGVTQASAMGLGVGPSVGGQRPRDNNFTVEGVDNNNKTVTGALITVPPDAVDNFTLLSNQFDTEFGHSSGGQFNTTIKSGTNGFHGSLYEYFRNRNLNAVDNIAALQGLTSNPRFDSNRYGATFGGPIIKNKLFFFSNFERQPVGLTAGGGGTVQTPTAAGLAAIATDPGASATNLAIFKQYVPVAGSANGCIPYDGVSNGVTFGTFSAPANGTCAAGSVEVGNVSIVPPSFENFENFVQSVDFNISSRDQLRGRYVYNKLDEIDTAAQLGAFYENTPFRFHLFTLGEYHTFSPSVLNEFRVGFNRYANTTPAGNFPYPGLDAFPNILLFDLGSGLNIGPDGNAPQFTIQNFYSAVDNISWTKGKHTFKFGGEYREYISPQSFTQRQRGDYEYNSTQVYLEDFSPDNFGQRSTGSITYYGNQQAIYWYANDNWRVTPNLTLNLGIRYEFTTNPESESRQALNSLVDTPSLIVPQVNQPFVFKNPSAPKKNFAPRVGFAYSPGGNGNTSIRGGFGMAYDVLYDNIGILAVPPQVGSTNNVNPSALTPGFLAGGGLSGGGSGITPLSQADAFADTANWIPPQTKLPYSINWNFGIQHSFKNYVAEVRYVGTRGVHLDVQNIINLQALVTPAHFLPTYVNAPSQATLDALPNTLAALSSGDPEVASYENAGFGNLITAFLPIGDSTYHGLQSSLQRRFSNGLAFQASYTYSRTIDDSTADFHSTDITPRRQQDFQDLAEERAVSPLSRTHRFTLAAVYQLPYFKSGNWLTRNVLGNWEFSPVYTYESPEWVTVQSNLDANLNVDSAGDRAVFNPGGVKGTGSDVTPLLNTAGDTVAYLANSNAEYIRAAPGALATSSRNTLATPPTNNIDLGVYKDFNITERMKFRFGAQFANVINHAQFIAGANPGQGLGVNDVNSFSSVGTTYKSYLTPGNAAFNNPQSVFASNSRTIALVAKFTF